MLLKLERFLYATSLDFDMGYYHIRLTPESSSYCTVIFPWGKYEYLRLPMGLCNSPDIFQEKMGELFYDLEYVRAYIDDLLVLTNEGDYETHLQQLEKVFQLLRESGLKVNATKSFFCTTTSNNPVSILKGHSLDDVSVACGTSSHHSRKVATRWIATTLDCQVECHGSYWYWVGCTRRSLSNTNPW
jgi:hypothetical protein